MALLAGSWHLNSELVCVRLQVVAVPSQGDDEPTSAGKQPGTHGQALASVEPCEMIAPVPPKHGNYIQVAPSVSMLPQNDSRASPNHQDERRRRSNRVGPAPTPTTKGIAPSNTPEDPRGSGEASLRVQRFAANWNSARSEAHTADKPILRKEHRVAYTSSTQQNT